MHGFIIKPLYDKKSYRKNTKICKNKLENWEEEVSLQLRRFGVLPGEWVQKWKRSYKPKISIGSAGVSTAWALSYWQSNPPLPGLPQNKVVDIFKETLDRQTKNKMGYLENLLNNVFDKPVKVSTVLDVPVNLINAFQWWYFRTGKLLNSLNNQLYVCLPLLKRLKREFNRNGLDIKYTLGNFQKKLDY